jgi:hypothetical protein
LPRQQRESASDGLQENFRTGDPGQIEIAREIVDELFDRDMAPSPKRDVVEMLSQDRRGQASDQQLVSLELLADPHRQRIIACQPRGLPCDDGLRRQLFRNQQPLIGLRQARDHGAVRRLLLGLGLLSLLLVEIERLFFGNDRRPGEISPQGLVEVLQPHLVGGEEHERIAIETRRVAARFQDRLGRDLRRVAALLAIGMLGRQDDEARIVIVRNVGA